MAAALVMAVQARATLYDIGFTASDNSILANGNVDVNGSQIATSGQFTIFVGPSWLQGTYALIPTTGPGVNTSPALGGYVCNYDNWVNPAADPFIDSHGLLFSNGETVLDINLMGNSPGNNGYEFGVLTAAGVVIDVTGGASISLAPVPEPTTMVAGALLLLPFGASTLRILRKRTA